MAKAKQAGPTALTPPTNATDTIHVRGARVNNLQNISIDLPKKKITVFATHQTQEPFRPVQFEKKGRYLFAYSEIRRLILDSASSQ